MLYEVITEQETTQKKLDPSQLDLPETLPIMPLHGFVFYPGMSYNFV